MWWEGSRSGFQGCLIIGWRFTGWDEVLKLPLSSGLQVRGYGMSGDGHHVTQPHPEGLGAQLSMRAALRGSGVDAADVAYINAHATSTPQGGWGVGGGRGLWWVGGGAGIVVKRHPPLRKHVW